MSINLDLNEIRLLALILKNVEDDDFNEDGYQESDVEALKDKIDEAKYSY